MCTGAYDDEMIRAWVEWDKKHNSENDHPSEFSEKQVANHDNSIYYFLIFNNNVAF